MLFRSRMDHDLKIIFSERGCALPTSDEAASVGKSLSGQAPSNPAPCQDLNPATMASALAAWTNSGLVHDYYQNTHRRNSVDGNGLPLRSIVNFGGESFQNAAWFDDRKIMLYGNGGSDGRFNDFASPLDVVAHEITHGVTSSTAALQYASEQGALNESYSDVFGKLVAFSKGKA